MSVLSDGIAIVIGVLGGLFKKKNYCLWGIRYNGTAWILIGTAPANQLKAYQPVLFGEGWRTLILAPGITPQLPPK